MKGDPFDLRRDSDPQGLIRDLVSQTTKQANLIHSLNIRVKELETALAKQILDKPDKK